MVKVLKSMNSLSRRRDRYFRTALAFFLAGWGAIFSGREIGIVIAALIFMAAAAYFQRGKIWGAGATGENQVMSLLKKLPGEVYILNDLTIPKEGGTAQIDHVVIAEYGVFCIETKNYGGTLTGKDDHCIHYTKKGQNRIYSPSRQTLDHTKALRKLLAGRPEYWEAGGEGLWIEPMLVFSGPNIRLRYSSNDVTILKLKNLDEFFEKHIHKKVIPVQHLVNLALHVLASDLH